MKRNHDVRVKLSKEERELLTKRAERIGLNLSTYLRYIALNTSVKVD